MLVESTQVWNPSEQDSGGGSVMATCVTLDTALLTAHHVVSLK